MANIFLDCCADMASAQLIKQYREGTGHTNVTIVDDVQSVRRYMSSQAGGAPPVIKDQKRYYPDGHSEGAPPKVFVFSVG